MLVLDSEALSAAATRPGPTGRRVAGLIQAARHREEPVVTSAAVLAEVVRGRPRDAAVNALLRRSRIAVVPVDRSIATRAGILLESVRSGSERAVDAFLVATAEAGAPARILTGDRSDIGALAAYCDGVTARDLDHR